MAYNDYKDVTPLGTENPAQEGWYEKSGSTYFKTTDTTIHSGKTYYQKGFLVKVGNYTIPFRYIKADTFQGLWSTTDVDSYRDAYSTAHRDSVQPRHPMKVEFETPDMSDTEIRTLLANIQSQYLPASTLWNGKQAKTCLVTAWIGELGVYKEDYCYAPDIPMSIRYADENEIRYNPVRIAFIGYASDKAQ